MPEVKALKLGEQLEVPQPKHAPFFKLPRNECMVTVSGGGKTNAHIQTLTDPKMLGGSFDRYYIFCPNAKTDPTYKVFIDCVKSRAGQKTDEFVFTEWDPQEITEIMKETRTVNDTFAKNRKQLEAKRLMSAT